MSTKHIPEIIMLGTSLESKGGIASVVGIYQKNDFFKQNKIKYIETHKTEGAADKVTVLIKAILIFISAILRYKIKIVHIHSASYSSFFRKSIFIVICRLFSIPYIFHLHGGGFLDFYSNGSRLLQKWICYVLKKARTIILINSTWEDRIFEISNNDSIIFIPNAADVEELPALPGRTNRNLLFLGDINENKGVYDLLRSLVKVVNDYPDAKLIVAGTGEIEKAKSLCEELKITANVEFPGWVSGDKKKDLLIKSDIFLLPSYYENIPVSLLEAMAYKITPVVSNVGGMPDVVDEASGIVMSPGNINELTQALSTLLANTQNSKKLGENARKRVIDKFSPQKILPQINSIYAAIN